MSCVCTSLRLPCWSYWAILYQTIHLALSFCAGSWLVARTGGSLAGADRTVRLASDRVRPDRADLGEWFDILYALQDGPLTVSITCSVPEWLGRRKALSLSIIVHVLTAALVIVAGQIADGGTWYWIGAGFFTAMLIYQHMLVKPDDISRVNLAFATTNGMASVAFGILVIADILF